MKTIKIIDLLNKIANYEEVPEFIKFDGKIYEYNNHLKNYENGEDGLLDGYRLIILNDEVEIIEESKKIEHISMFTEMIGSISDMDDVNKYIHILFKQQTELHFKLVEIINKINEMEN